MFHFHAEDLGELAQLVDGQSDVVAFPSRIRRLGNAQGIRNFALGKVGLFAQQLNALPEGGALGFGGATSVWHVGNIVPADKIYRFSLHDIGKTYRD